MIENNRELQDDKSFRVNGSILFFGAIILVVVTVFLTFLVADRIYYNGALFRKSESVSFSGDELDEYKVAKFQDLLNFIDEYYCLDYEIKNQYIIIFLHIFCYNNFSKTIHRCA